MSARKYIVTVEARADLESIAAFGPDSRKVLLAVRRAIRNLAEFPESGRLRADLGHEALRTWPVSTFIIVYRADLRPVPIVRVIYGARDLATAMRGQ